MKEEEERERESENQTSLSHSVITSSRLRLNRRDITVSDSLCGLTKTLSRRQLLLPLLSVMEAVETKHNVLHVILLLPRSRCLRMSRRRNINQKNYRNCRERWGGKTPNMLFWFFLQTLILAVVQIKTLISLHSSSFSVPLGTKQSRDDRLERLLSSSWERSVCDYSRTLPPMKNTINTHSTAHVQ